MTPQELRRQANDKRKAAKLRILFGGTYAEADELKAQARELDRRAVEIESLDEAILDCLRRAPQSKPDPECICGGPLVLDQPGGEHECTWCGRRAWL